MLELSIKWLNGHGFMKENTLIQVKDRTQEKRTNIALTHHLSQLSKFDSRTVLCLAPLQLL